MSVWICQFQSVSFLLSVIMSVWICQFQSVSFLLSVIMSVWICQFRFVKFWCVSFHLSDVACWFCFVGFSTSSFILSVFMSDSLLSDFRRVWPESLLTSINLILSLSLLIALPPPLTHLSRSTLYLLQWGEKTSKPSLLVASPGYSIAALC
uniref:Uncharacterized protein n=1 Tax=Strigamia maritima TaxID=126957 RepID=T1ISL7_STRMM